MGNEAASVAILRCNETPIKADYDVDKVTQQIPLIYTRQETSVFPSFFSEKKEEKMEPRKNLLIFLFLPFG